MAKNSKRSTQPEKQDYDPAVAETQRVLKQQGFFPHEIDGRAGQKTTDAIQARDAKLAADREATAKAEERELKKLELQTQGKTASAAADDVASKTRAREERQAQAATPAGIATQIGATTVAPLAGVAAGRGIGLGINALMDQSQASKNAALAGVAADRTAGLTTREGALSAALRSGAMPSGNSAARVGGRMLPHLALGGFMAGKGGVLLSQEDPEGAFYPEMANKAAALGMLGAGTGIAERGITYGVSPGVAPDARAMAVIGSNQLRRNGQGGQGSSPATPGPATPQTPALEAPGEPQAPRAGTKAFMAAQAKDLGIKGTSAMTKSDLATALSQALAEHGAKRTTGKRLPKITGPGSAAAIAGSLAYGMTPDRAEAADGSSSGGMTEGLTNAGIAGGAAYGTSKLAQALGPAVRGTLGMAGDAMAPVTIDAMTDYSPDDLAQGRNFLARNLPESMQFGAVDQARQMATLPTPNPDRSQMAQDQNAQAQAMPMASASALQIPEGIPAPREDGASPYAEPVMRRVQRMQATGASPDQIAMWLNQAHP